MNQYQTKEVTMKSVRLLLGFALSITLAFTAGCSTFKSVTSTDAKASPTTTAHVKCVVQEQKGCLDIQVLNLRWNPENPLMKGLDRPAASQEERLARSAMGPMFWRAYKANEVGPSLQARSFVFLMWNIDTSVPMDHIAAWRVDGLTVTKTQFADVTGTVVPPVFDPVSNLGAPQKVFRVKAEGAKPIGVSLTIPSPVFTKDTVVLVCSEDKLTKYPNRETANEGLWVSKETLQAIRRKGWTYAMMPFISKDPDGTTATSTGGGFASASAQPNPAVVAPTTPPSAMPGAKAEEKK